MNIIPVVPYPKKVEVYKGRLVCPRVKIIYDPFFAEETALAAVQLTDAGLCCVSAPENAVWISVEQTAPVGKMEAYALEITGSGIVIRAADPAGVFYAFQTLRQLVMTYSHTLPLISVSDEPDCAWRGFMLDTSRTFFPAAFLEKMIDAAAFHKMNRFHWHLTDDQGWRLPVPEYPLLTQTGAWRTDHRLPVGMQKDCGGESDLGYYTDEEIQHLVRYASERHVTVVPEVELPGHVSALLASYPEMGCTGGYSGTGGGGYCVEDRWGIFPDVICAGNDAVFRLYGAVFDTLCRLFSGKWVHIGGDECLKDRWKACPKCQTRMKKEGLTTEDELQAWVTVRMAEMLESRGKIPIGWDEVLDGTEHLKLPDSLVVQSWRSTGDNRKVFQSGHQKILSPRLGGCYFDYKNCDSPMEPGRLGVTTVKSSYDFSPHSTTGGAVPAGGCSVTSVIGGECALWTEAVTSAKLAEYMLFPRLCAFSEALWLDDSRKDFSRFSRILPAHKKRLNKMDILFYQGKLK
jgi:hexosaminidase